MSYSRKQLEAFGEPFGESATRKEAGRVIYGSGGGGGGSSTQVTDLPDWAKPYAQETLEKTKQLSNAPYQSYDAPRFAGFSPMQEKAQQTAYNMGTSGQLGTGTGLATAAGLMGLGANYQPGSFANQFQAPQQYQPSQFDMMSAQAPNLQQFQMGPAERAQTQSFTQPGSAESFMSPYMQNVVDKQTREAERQSGIAARQQRAQSIQRGSFGGGRTAVTEAANARDLAQLKSDIYGTGQQAAFQNAQQQFNAEQQARMQAQLANQQAGLTVGGQNLAAQLGVQQLGAGQNMQAQIANQQAYQDMLRQREGSRQFGAGQGMTAAQLQAQYGQAAQQLGEQSRQFGAGYGQQGLNTALQAAGQLGNLGQAEFGQQKDIVGLQSQLGGQQQALRQQGMTQAYQDFLNEQNYPYKQLGFMSDMIRGLPLGQQTTRQVYEAPGSMLGQVAGLGVGLGGMARFGQMFADGGEVEKYADGGSVDSPQNVASIVRRLSDEQLPQAKQAAQARGDYEQLQAIMAEESRRASAEQAMQASERGGLAGAFNQLPDDTQDNIVSAAGGGIVAFANGGDSSYDTLEQKRLAQPRPAPRSRSTTQRQVSPAVHQGINQIAEQAGLPRETVEARYARILKDIEEKDAGDIKAIRDMVEKSTGGSREVKEGALGRALADFGFKWAAAAAKPGARFLSSAAEAAPTLSASVAESAKLAREMDQNDAKLRTAQRQFELSRRADNRKEATVFAGQIEQLERQQEMLALKRRELAQTGAAQQAALKQRGEQFNRMMTVREETARAATEQARTAREKVESVARQKWEEGPAARVSRQLEQQYGKNWRSSPEAQADFNQRKNAYIRGQSTVSGDSTPLSSLMSNEEMLRAFGFSE